MSLIYPLNMKSRRITQVFGVNFEAYKRFNLLGHNGVDISAPIGTQLIAPIEGVVVEVDFDANGYGWYVKIENTTEGALTAHMSRVDVQIGFVVEMGQQIGLSGNTGNSTGPHVHFGYYRIPRDRSNGFNGYINPEPYFIPIGGSNMTDQILNTYGLDDTNIASKQVVYDAWKELSSGAYVKAADVNKTITDLNLANTNLNNQLKELKEKFDISFAFLAQVQDLGFKDIEQLKSTITPYLEMSAAGFPDLESIKKQIVDASTDVTDSNKVIIDLTTKLEILNKIIEDLRLKNINLETTISNLKTEYALYDKNTFANKVARLVQIIMERLKLKQPQTASKVEAVATMIDPEAAESVLTSWDSLGKALKSNNN